MFSPKVLAVIGIIVVVIALLLMNFESIADKFKGALKNENKGTGAADTSQFGKGGQLDLTVYPQGAFVLRPDSSINITVDSTVFSDFLGEVRADYVNKTVRFTDSRTPLKVELPLNKVDLGSLRLAKLSFPATKMGIKKDGWSKTLENGTVEIEGFTGMGTINADSFKMIGNVTRFVEK